MSENKKITREELEKKYGVYFHEWVSDCCLSKLEDEFYLCPKCGELCEPVDLNNLPNKSV